MKLLSKLALTACLTFASLSSLSAQTTLNNWTFENTAIVGASGSDFTYGPSDAGLLSLGSSADGHHATATTAYSFPAGQAPSAPRALSANNWSVNDYWQFSLTTVGFQNLTVSFGQLGSATGPANYQFQYSTDGTTFTNFGTAITLTSSSTFKTSTFDLSSVTDVNNALSVVFRVVDTSTTAIGGGTVGTTGSGRIDNFLLTGIPIPEPSVYMLLGLGLLICGQRFLGRKSA